MTQPVTALGSPELASKLEELSGVALQIAHCFNELRAMLPSDLLTNSASACALFHVAISNAHGCLSLLQSVNQAPIPPPPTPPFVPPSVASSRSPTPNIIDSCTFLSLPSRPSPPATQKWLQSSTPLVSAVLESLNHPSSGGSSAKEHSPLPPLRTRHRVSIAELVDEENSSPDTRGGVNPHSRPASTHANVSTAHTYPPLIISIIDVTPRSTRGPGGPEVSGVMPLRSSSRSPPMSPARNYRTTNAVGKIPHRSKRKEVPPTASGSATGQRVTRSFAKRKATNDPDMETSPSKRARSVYPSDG